jgi:hypothetical protein
MFFKSPENLSLEEKGRTGLHRPSVGLGISSGKAFESNRCLFAQSLGCFDSYPRRLAQPLRLGN